MIENIPEIFNNQISTISIINFLFNLVWSGILALVIAWTYKNYGKSLSNRSQFSYNFFIITMTTMIIITVVKSSLALSLGLVGALSIIRFRTAIKEPEELSYLFLSIAAGLGMGADQFIITTFAIFVILTAIISYQLIFGEARINENVIITIESQDFKNIKTESYLEIITSNCLKTDLRRLNTKEHKFEASFIVELKDQSSLDIIQKKLRELDSKISISFIDNKGIFH